MISIDPQASLKFFRSIASHTDRDVQRRLDRFQDSLSAWLHSALNWPLDDWEADLRLFVEHSRYAGWEISPHSVAQIRELLETRANRTGPFAASHAARTQDVDRPTIQLAAVMAPGEDTDATLDLTSKSESEDDTDNAVGLEVAGPGPDVSEPFKSKVQSLLDILDAVAAEVWKSEGGIIRSRDARGWLFDYYSERIDGHPAIVVDQSYSAGDTAAAILEEAYTSRANPIRSEMLRRWISEDGAEVRLREIQTQAYREAAAEAAMLVELYYGSLSSLTSAGDLVVTLDDIERNGLSLSHALILLPGMAVLGKKAARLFLKSKSGKILQVPQRLLRSLERLPKAARDKLLVKVDKAKNAEEVVKILEHDIKDVTVYVSKKGKNTTQYVGLTNQFAIREAVHLRQKGIRIEALMPKLSLTDAHAVEQALIQIHHLQKDGGTLMNKINSIAKSRPDYTKQLQRGLTLLKSIGYKP